MGVRIWKRYLTAFECTHDSSEALSRTIAERSIQLGRRVRRRLTRAFGSKIQISLGGQRTMPTQLLGHFLCRLVGLHRWGLIQASQNDPCRSERTCLRCGSTKSELDHVFCGRDCGLCQSGVHDYRDPGCQSYHEGSCWCDRTPTCYRCGKAGGDG
jgi:hypothetical protein